MTDYKKVLNNDYVKTAIAIALVVCIALGFFFGLGLVLGTEVPIRVVQSGSMCTDQVDVMAGLTHLNKPCMLAT